MVKFFIDRPIFAWVIAIMMMLAGVLAITTQPVSQYPPIAPPAITVTAAYPGASAKTVENTVTQIIEQKMTGLDDLLYFSSSSDSAGNASVTLTFQPGTVSQPRSIPSFARSFTEAYHVVNWLPASSTRWTCSDVMWRGSMRRGWAGVLSTVSGS